MFFVQRLTRFFMRLVTRILYNITVVDETAISTDYPTILVSNHKRILDPFVIAAYMPRKVLQSSHLMRAMTASGYYYNKALHLYLWSMGCFPAKTTKGHTYIGVEGALKILNEGHGVLIFPEGKRVSESEQSHVYPGIAHIRSEAPKHNVILVKVEYTKRRGLRTKLNLCFFQENLDNKDAEGIMQAIYQKGFTDHA